MKAEVKERRQQIFWLYFAFCFTSAFRLHPCFSGILLAE